MSPRPAPKPFRPFFSIVVPLHDKAGHVGRALSSVLAQTDKGWEVIVVDDGSTDGGGDLVSARYPWARLVRQVNQGAAAARNRGIRLARAPFVAFLDADDEWRTDFLEGMRGLIHRHPGAVLYSASGHVHRPLGVSRNRQPGVPPDFEGILPDYWKAASRSFLLLTSATVARRKALLAAGCFDPQVTAGEDLEMWARLAIQGSFCYMDRPLSLYYRNTGSHGTDRKDKDYRPFLSSLDRSLKRRLPPAQRSGLLLYRDFIRLKTARALLLSGKRKEARSILASLDPSRLGGKVRLLFWASFFPLPLFNLYRRIRNMAWPLWFLMALPDLA